MREKAVELQKTRKEKGQSLVEFALVIPLLLLLMVGIFEFGYFFFVYSSVTMAAREAARYGSGTGNSVNAEHYYWDCDGINDRAQQIGKYAGALTVNIFFESMPPSNTERESENNGSDFSDRSGFIKKCDELIEDDPVPAVGDRIVVQVSVKYKPLILSWNGLNTVDIKSESARTIIRRMQVGG